MSFKIAWLFGITSFTQKKGASWSSGQRWTNIKRFYSEKEMEHDTITPIKIPSYPFPK